MRVIVVYPYLQLKRIAICDCSYRLGAAAHYCLNHMELLGLGMDLNGSLTRMLGV